MDLIFLGTGAGMPTLERNVTSIALRMYEERGSLWLFDCGEGTQHQMLKSPVKAGRIEKLFVTHLHGDHIYGIPGLLTSRSYQGGEAPLTVYGPPGIRPFIENALQLSQARLGYRLDIVEIAPGVVFEDEQFRVETDLLDHRVDSYGYRITESDSPGKLDAEKLRRLGVPHGPLFGKLKRGEDIGMPDGSVVRSQDVLGAPKRGRIVVILGDTRVCPASARLARKADALVHEATFSHDLAHLAREYHHATARQAAETARDAEVRALILTHISSRYQASQIERLLDEARTVFFETFVAGDFFQYEIRREST